MTKQSDSLDVAAQALLDKAKNTLRIDVENVYARWNKKKAAPPQGEIDVEKVYARWNKNAPRPAPQGA